jgi:hypothetical protein
MYPEYNDSISTGDRANCEEVVIANPHAHGFLQEGAVQIARRKPRGSTLKACQQRRAST